MHFKSSWKSLNDWSDLSKHYRRRGARWNVCVFVYERETETSAALFQYPAAHHRRGELQSFSVPPQHSYTYKHRKVTYRKTNKLYEVLWVICGPLPLNLCKTNYIFTLFRECEWCSINQKLLPWCWVNLENLSLSLVSRAQLFKNPLFCYPWSGF